MGLMIGEKVPSDKHPFRPALSSTDLAMIAELGLFTHQSSNQEVFISSLQPLGNGWFTNPEVHSTTSCLLDPNNGGAPGIAKALARLSQNQPNIQVVAAPPVQETQMNQDQGFNLEQPTPLSDEEKLGRRLVFRQDFNRMRTYFVDEISLRLWGSKEAVTVADDQTSLSTLGLTLLLAPGPICCWREKVLSDHEFRVNYGKTQHSEGCVTQASEVSASADCQNAQACLQKLHDACLAEALEASVQQIKSHVRDSAQVVMDEPKVSGCTDPDVSVAVASTGEVINGPEQLAAWYQQLEQGNKRRLQLEQQLKEAAAAACAPQAGFYNGFEQVQTPRQHNPTQAPHHRIPPVANLFNSGEVETVVTQQTKQDPPQLTASSPSCSKLREELLGGAASPGRATTALIEQELLGPPLEKFTGQTPLEGVELIPAEYKQTPQQIKELHVDQNLVPAEYTAEVNQRVAPTSDLETHQPYVVPQWPAAESSVDQNLGKTQIHNTPQWPPRPASWDSQQSASSNKFQMFTMGGAATARFRNMVCTRVSRPNPEWQDQMWRKTSSDHAA